MPSLVGSEMCIREDLHTIWRCQNINAVDRLGMSDHGPIHMQIVVNIALRLLRMLVASGLTPNLVKDHQLTSDDAEVVVCLLYTSDAADDLLCVDLGGRRIIKK